LDIGDAFLGSLYFTFFGGEVELATMAHLGYRAMAMGNHDFDGGGLSNLRAKLQAHAPDLNVLCANVRHEGGGKVDIFHDFKVFSVGGVRVAVVGLMGGDAWQVTASSLRRGLVWEEPLPCARRLVRHLRAKNTADVYLCCSHTGINRGDREIAAAALFDAVLSGHEHASVTDHEWSLVSNGLANGLGGTMLQPGWYGGRHVARLELGVGPDGSAAAALTCLAATSDIIDSQYEEDAEMCAILVPYKASFEQQIEEVVGSSWSSDFVKERMGLPDRHLYTPEVLDQSPSAKPTSLRGSSCPLGTLVAEAFRTYTTIEPQHKAADLATATATSIARYRADFAMVNTGAIRASLPGKGQPVRWKDIDGVWPWPDDGLPVAFKLPGSAIRNLLTASNITRFALRMSGMCYQFTGLRYTLHMHKDAPEQKLHIAEIWIGDQLLDENAIYTGVTSRYCLEEDILSTLKISGVEQLPAKPIVDCAFQGTKSKWEPISLKDYLMRYVTEHSPLRLLEPCYAQGTGDIYPE